MAAERKEPTISSIVPDTDEIDTHQQRINGSRPQSQAQQYRTRNLDKPPPAPVRAASSPLTPFAFLLALTGLGLAGFVYWQLLAAQQLLTTAEERIVVLEKRLELSDDESSQSLTAIQAKLKEADSEIRKLWGVAYDRNRKKLEEHASQLGSLEKTLTATVVDTRKAQQLATATNTKLREFEKEGAEQRQRVDKVASSLNEQQLQVQAAVDVVNRLQQQVTRLQSDLATRVKNNEESIKAIDAYRLNLNRDLLQLRQQLNQTSQRPAAPAAPAQ